MDQFTVMVGGIVYVFNDFQLWEVMDMLDHPPSIPHLSPAATPSGETAEAKVSAQTHKQIP